MNAMQVYNFAMELYELVDTTEPLDENAKEEIFQIACKLCDISSGVLLDQHFAAELINSLGFAEKDLN